MQKTLIPLLLLLLVTTGARAGDVLRLATTTSTQNSGLLDYLLPAFERDTGYTVHVIAVGTGKALRMGQDGDADVLLVHAPAAEREFIDAGFGVNRRPVMWNDFVLIGPPSDPAGVRGSRDTAGALAHIAAAGARFVSRGDESGTHHKERALWQAAGIRPQGGWYVEAGRGMGKVLQMASELGGYTLADRGTWIAYRGRTDLRVAAEGDTRLINPYTIISINPERFPDLNHAGAKALTDWITAPRGRGLIAAFRVGGDPLFHPTTLLAEQ